MAVAQTAQQSTKLLRKQLKQQRASLSPARQRALSQQAALRLARSRPFRAARHIGLYLPVRGEADPTTLYHHYAHPLQHFYLPVLALSKQQGLVFVAWTEQTRFRKNRFNIPEPVMTASNTRSPTTLDLVITPLLGFDATGTRLGMGGGFYDRSFAFKRRLPKRTSPRLVGFAYAFQQASQLERQSWDVPLDAVCTDTQLLVFNH